MSVVVPLAQCWLFIVLTGLFNPVEADWFKQAQDIMGTRVSVELWSTDKPHAAHCADLVFAEMQRINALMSPYLEDSELSAINRDAAIKPVRVSAELYELILQSIQFSKLSDGAFDITFASIGHQYDYRLKLSPSAETIRQQLDRIDYRQLQLENQSVHFAKPGMRIDLGGIAKGYAVDRGISILRKCKIQHAIVSAGGDSRILGDKQGRPWMMGIQHPRKKQAVALALPLSDSAISTSGDYERYFLINDQRIHHIINPRTGESAHGSWSASVIGPDATSTDALSTTLFILGAEKGMQLINTLENMDAVIIDNNGKVHYSSGLIPPREQG